MNLNYRLEKSKVCLLVIDVQEKLLPQMERSADIMQAIQTMIQGFQIMNLPIVVSEQYPEGLGSTVCSLKKMFEKKMDCFSKTTFSCFAEPELAKKLADYDQIIVAGIEAHICVLQTVKDLLHAGKQVVVLNDAISSRSIYDFSTAIAEMSRAGARISSVETVLFELIHDAKSEEFRSISLLVK